MGKENESPDSIWTNAQYCTLTQSAINLLTVLWDMDGREYNYDFREEADRRHRILQGTARKSPKLSKVETYITAFEEQGWTSRVVENGKKIFRFTEAGKQAYMLIKHAPDYLKFLPYFLVEIITRYQQWNPSRRGESYLSKGDIFPYWALFKIMRECSNYISEDEFRRFLVKITHMKQIPDVVTKIKKYRKKLSKKVPIKEIDREFGEPIRGTPARPLYFMHRAGVGFKNFSQNRSGIIVKEGRCPLGTPIYHLNQDYEAFIDYMLSHPPRNLPKDINVNQWFAHYGAPVMINIAPQDLLDDEDPVWKEVKENLLDQGIKRILLSGPPGTSKTWYAEKIALKIVNGDTSRVEKVQFHQSYSYEDFIEGYVPNPQGSGFILKDKIFKRICEKALLDPQRPYVLVIDEFTRGDASRIFGEILTYMEYPHKSVKLLYSEEDFYMPENLIIIGTMNPFDRSISDLDIMMERRFKRIDMVPSTRLLRKILSEQGIPSELIERVVDFFEKVQDIYEIGFGHAYFVGVKDEEDLRRLWKYQLRDLFKKYFQYEPEKFREIRRLYPWSE